MESTARVAGYGLVVANSDPRDSPDAAVNHVIARGVDGITVIGNQAQVFAAIRRADSRIPIVSLESASGEEPEAIYPGHLAGAALAVEHLIALGHTRIAHVGGTAGWLEAEAREVGYRQAMEGAGLEPFAVVRGDWSGESGERSVPEIQRLGATAVFAANDRMALGLLHGARMRGVRVPEQLSVVGFDDVPGADFAQPALTTIRQDFGALGRRAVQLLLGMLGEAVAVDPVSAPILVLRGSTAALVA